MISPVYPGAMDLPAVQPPPGVLSSRHQLPISYDPAIPQRRVATAQRQLIGSAVSAGISLVIFLVLFFVGRSRERIDDLFTLFFLASALSSIVGLLILGARIFWLVRAQMAAREVGEGLALVLSGAGVQIAAGSVGWEEVSRVAVAKGRLGFGYRLRIERHDGQYVVFPLEGLGILPGTLDAAVRAYSAGRQGVDLSVLDD